MTDKENLEVQAELDMALDKVTKEPTFPPYLFANKYNGEVSPYKTPANYKPDDGVLNTEKDLCHTEDYISIQQIYARLKAMKQLSIQDSDYAYDASNLNTDDLQEDTLSDLADAAEDGIDNYDLVDYVNAQSANNVSVTASQKGTETLDAKGTEDGASTQGEATDDVPSAS